jgi:hypothetical protein
MAGAFWQAGTSASGCIRGHGGCGVSAFDDETKRRNFFFSNESTQ